MLTHTGGADLHDDFGLTITDANGKTGSDTLRVAITDTTPRWRGHQLGHRRCGAQRRDGQRADRHGRGHGVQDSGLTVATLDGTAVTTAGTTINGAYGTLVIKADGSYTYIAEQRTAGGQPAQ